MARVYKSVCNEVDIVLFNITRLVEKQIKYKLEMERLMNKGFVKIAKARYIMGSTCVTKMQLPSENSNPIQPVATVCRVEKDNYWVFHIHRKDVPKESVKNSLPLEYDEYDEGVDFMQDQLSDSTISSETSGFSESDFKKTLQNNPKSLKKSKYAYHVNDRNYEERKEELLDEFSNKGSNESLYSFTDPMRLFGILVPNTLKGAQDDFKRVVALIGKCATLQAKLKESLHRYNHLHKVKVLMEIAAAEAKINIVQTKIYWTLSEDSMTSSHTDAKEEENDNNGKDNVTKSVVSIFFENKGDSESKISKNFMENTTELQ